MTSLGGKLKAALGILRDSGPTALKRRVAEWNLNRRQETLYQKWLVKNGSISDDRIVEMRAAIATFLESPLISVIIPVYNIDEKWLRLCVESVVNQIYPKWELCIADDASPAPHVRRVLEEYAATDNRIKIEFRTENGHISAASNSALDLVTGDFVVLLDHDDELSRDALFWVAKEINEYPRTAIIYSDEDLIDESGWRFGPKFKPDFSRDLLYSLNLMTHLSAYRTDLLRAVGGFRTGYEGSQDYDLELRAIEQIGEDQIRHIPRVLYHWRVIRGSVAFSMDEKPYAHERARDTIRDHFERTGVSADVVESFHNLHRVKYKSSDKPHRAALIISTDDDVRNGIGLAMNLESEIVAAAPADRAKRLNAAVSRSKADVLIFIDGDLKFADADAITDLIDFALQPQIGAAAGRILTPDLFVEQAGVVIQGDASPAYAHNGFPREAPGNMYRNRQISNFSAVTVSLMAIRRELFEELGGFDECEDLAELFDIDLCLRLWQRKKRIVVLPHVELIRHSKMRERANDIDKLKRFATRWPEYAEADPFCNRNLKRDGSFEIDL